MPDKFTFVVEGNDDEKFLTDILSIFYSEKFKNSKVEFYLLKNNANELQKTEISLLARQEAGNQLLIVLDADLESYVNTKSVINNYTKNLNTEIFLFPDDKSFGRLETLLRGLIPESNKTLFNCIDSYKSCLSKLQNVPVNKFDHHNEIFVYVDSLKDGGSSKGTVRDYSKTHVWDLNSDQLKPLLSFLDKVFK